MNGKGPTWRSTALRASLSTLLGRLARLRTLGVENIPPRGGCLLVFNQVSLVDTPLLSVIVPRRDVTGLVARDYRANPVWRLLVECGGGMWIRRRGADRSALRAALEALRGGWVVGISPEGRRSPTQALTRGRPGPAFLARRSGAPIVPVGFENTDLAAATWRRLARPAIVVRVGTPFSLPPTQGRSRKGTHHDDTDRIMCRIAALLPPRYHGVYAGHPYLEELIGRVGPGEERA